MTDLFGDLVTLPSGRRGRPSHVWTKSNADKVIIGLALGYSDAEIANGLGISPPTLKKHYFSEMKRRQMQRTRLEIWQAATLAELAGTGNVGAMKELRKIVSERDRKHALERFGDDDDAPVPRVGKKEQARLDAADVVKGDSADDWGNLLKPGAYEH